jgi:hypothetical protein
MELVFLIVIKDSAGNWCYEDAAFLESAIKINWILKNGSIKELEFIRKL